MAGQQPRPQPNYNPFDVALTLTSPPPASAAAQYTPGGYVPPPFALSQLPGDAYQPGAYDPTKPPASASGS